MAPIDIVTLQSMAKARPSAFSMQYYHSSAQSKTIFKKTHICFVQIMEIACKDAWEA
jgi:hypothetical protein